MNLEGFNVPGGSFCERTRMRIREGASVVIPCFNCGDHLGRTIDSLLAQSMMPEEILVIDDGSVDNSKEVADSYGNKVRVITKRNEGAASARYLGVLNSKFPESVTSTS